MSLYIPDALLEYPKMVLNEDVSTCEDVKHLVQYVSERFREENLYFNEEQYFKYLSYEKYFEKVGIRLFPWEKFIFGLHNCTYTEDRQFPRWQDLLLNISRGAGKNGYLAFEDFCLISPANPVKLYHIDCFAVAEVQSKKTFEEIQRVLEANERRLQHFFYWNQEYIKNTITGSVYQYQTSSSKSKDSGQQGKVDYDEVHQWENYKLIEVTNSGLGKKQHPRRTIASSNGYLTEGPLEDWKKTGRDILFHGIEDNSFLPLMTHIESEDEILNPDAWVKANPSLPYLPALMHEMLKQAKDYEREPDTHTDFPTKRLNFTKKSQSNTVATDEAVLATNRGIELKTGQPAIIGVDYGSRRDFAAVGHLTKTPTGEVQWRCQTFTTRKNPDLQRINAPLKKFESQGTLTFVDAEEIAPEVLIDWLLEEQEKHGLKYKALALDDYRYPYVKQAFERLGFSSEKKNILKVRPSNIMKIAPIIMSLFTNQKIRAENNAVFRWAIWNVKVEEDKHGNFIFSKIEPKSRKTDTFMAFCAAACLLDELPRQTAAPKHEFQIYF